MAKNQIEQAPESATAQEAETQPVETQAQAAPQSQPQEGKMAAKKKAVKPTKATTATHAGSNPAAQLNNTTKPPVCQGKTGENGIPSWADVQAQLRENLRASIEQAHAELEEAKERIAQAQAERQSQIAAAKGKVEKLEAQLKAVEGELSRNLAIARQTLSGEALEQMVGQINLAHAAETERLEGELNAARMTLATLEAADEAACEDERLELQMLQEHLRELEELDPEVAREVELRLSAKANARRAIRLARDGEVDEARAALELAKAGQAPAELLARAEKAIAEAERRAEIRNFIARIQAVKVSSRKALDQLAALAREAEERGITANVVSFLNYATKLARQASLQRKREEGRLWAVARKEAMRWAENGVPHPGAVLQYGPGVIRVYRQQRTGWRLEAVYYYSQVNGAWHRREPTARIVRSDLKSKNVVVVK